MLFTFLFFNSIVCDQNCDWEFQSQAVSPKWARFFLHQNILFWYLFICLIFPFSHDLNFVFAFPCALLVFLNEQRLFFGVIFSSFLELRISLFGSKRRLRMRFTVSAKGSRCPIACGGTRQSPLDGNNTPVLAQYPDRPRCRTKDAPLWL